MVLVLVIMGILARIALPRLSTGATRADAAAQQIRSVFLTSQRTSLTRQYDVIVSIDTAKAGLRIAEDVNNNGTIEVSEWKFWRPLGSGNQFVRPPVGLTQSIVDSPVLGSQLTKVDNLPSVIFHRDGSASSDVEVYVASAFKGRTDYRAVTLTRATGRSEMYRLAGTGGTRVWKVASP